MTKVILSLNTELQAYIRKEFNQGKGAVKITRNHSIGKYINSMLRFTKQRPVRSYHKSIIELIIPDTPYLDQEYYYAYFTKEDERKINDFIQANFNLNVEIFFIQGYRVGFKQKDIIESLIYYYNLPNDSSTYEKIKKRDFRRRISAKKIITEIMEKY